jgi:amidase
LNPTENSATRNSPYFSTKLKADLNAYLAGRAGALVHSLEELIAFNEKSREKEMPYFGQDVFIQAQAKGPLTSKEYLDALASNHRLARTEGIDGDHDSGGSSNAAAVAGYPDVTVPAGYIFGMPVGISFFGRAWSEPTLLKLAYAFEQVTKIRKPPQFLPSVKL